jgi:hypothetical protein
VLAVVFALPDSEQCPDSRRLESVDVTQDKQSVDASRPFRRARAGRAQAVDGIQQGLLEHATGHVAGSSQRAHPPNQRVSLQASYIVHVRQRVGNLARELVRSDLALPEQSI